MYHKLMFALTSYLSGRLLLSAAKHAKALGDEHEMLHLGNAILVGDTTNCKNKECWVYTNQGLSLYLSNDRLGKLD